MGTSFISKATKIASKTKDKYTLIVKKIHMTRVLHISFQFNNKNESYSIKSLPPDQITQLQTILDAYVG